MYIKQNPDQMYMYLFLKRYLLFNVQPNENKVNRSLDRYIN